MTVHFSQLSSGSCNNTPIKEDVAVGFYIVFLTTALATVYSFFGNIPDGALRRSL
jgi:hypothetical protein